MRLYTICKGCSQDVGVYSSAKSREELQANLENLDIRCKHCGNKAQPHVKDIHAELKLFYILIAFLIGIIFSVLFWEIFGMVGTFFILIPCIYWIYEFRLTHKFNTSSD